MRSLLSAAAVLIALGGVASADTMTPYHHYRHHMRIYEGRSAYVPPPPRPSMTNPPNEMTRNRDHCNNGCTSGAGP
jgi:hypothetical protein